MTSFPKVFCIVDTETTGMRAQFSRVIDIGIIRVENGRVVKKYQTLINPGTDIPHVISRITSIDNDDVRDAPTFEEVALDIQDILKGAVFVAHNATFDYAFIQAEFRRLGIAFKAQTLCSVMLSRALYPRERRHNLDAIIERFAIDMGERHRAMPDAEAVLQFFTKVNAAFGKKSLKETINRVMGVGIAKRVEKDSFMDLPEKAGVYFFYGPEQELLYIGKSKHVKTRARSHFHASSNSVRHDRMREQATSVHAQETSGELSALILEASLIKSQSPLYNRALRRVQQLVIARIANTDGYDHLVIERTGDVHADPSIVSIFRNMAQAKAKLRDLAKENNLCQKLMMIENGSGPCFGYQLGTCLGACVGKEGAQTYNERLADTFKTRRLKVWPYKGTVVITETEDEDRGTVFFVDNWSLRGAFKFEGGNYEPLVQSQAESPIAFDYDMYKILARYMRNPANRRSIKTVSDEEFKRLYAACTDCYEEVVR